MHPTPFVVQVEMIALQVLSVVNVIGSKAQVYGTQVVVAAFQAQVKVVDLAKGVLLHSEAFNKPPQVVGFDLH